MKQALLSLLIAVAIVGCYTQKKATEQTQKALIKYPGVVADITRTAFPCVTTASDTVITTQDSLIYIDCPDNGNGTGEDYLRDSLEWEAIKIRINKSQLGMGDTKLQPPLHIVGKTVRVPITLPVKTVTIVQKVEDSAKIYVLQAATLKLQADNDKLRGKVHSRNTWIKWLVIALLISAGLNFIQFKLNGLPKIKR